MRLDKSISLLNKILSKTLCLVVLGCLSILPSAFAETRQDSVIPQEYAALFNAPISDGELTKLSALLNAQHPLTYGEFEQERRLAILSRPLMSRGQFAMVNNEGMIWHQVSPFETTLVLKAASMITINTDGNTELNQATGAQASQIPQLMQAILKGDSETLTQYFQLFYLAAKQDSIWQLGLIAKDEMIKKALGTVILSGTSQQSPIDEQSDIANGIESITLFNAAPHVQQSQLDMTTIRFSKVGYRELPKQFSTWFEIANQALQGQTP